MDTHKVVIISGGTCSGKTVMMERLIAENPGQVGKAVTATTRLPRVGERHGRDYLFYSRDVFRSMIEGGKFLEHAEVHGKLYGTPIERVLRSLEVLYRTILSIDYQGHQAIRQLNHPLLTRETVVSFFINAPEEDLRRRMAADRKATPEDIRQRFEVSLPLELAAMNEYDCIIYNPDGGLDKAYAEIAQCLGL